MKNPPLRSLQDLKKAAKVLAEARAAQLEREREAAIAAQRAAASGDLFSRAIGRVNRLPATGQVVPLRPNQAPPLPLQRRLDEQAALQEALSDDFDVSALLETDAALSFRRPGIGADVCTRLRRGDWSIQAELDLHGLRTDDARAALTQFVRDAQTRGLRCVRVVHGKGLGSPGKSPVLKGRVQGWLVQKSEVLAFVQAKPAQGGAGALIVLLAGTDPKR